MNGKNRISAFPYKEFGNILQMFLIYIYFWKYFSYLELINKSIISKLTKCISIYKKFLKAMLWCANCLLNVLATKNWKTESLLILSLLLVTTTTSMINKTEFYATSMTFSYPSLKMSLNSSKLTCWSPSMSASETISGISASSSSLKWTPNLKISILPQQESWDKRNIYLPT